LLYMHKLIEVVPLPILWILDPHHPLHLPVAAAMMTKAMIGVILPMKVSITVVDDMAILQHVACIPCLSKLRTRLWPLHLLLEKKLMPRLLLLHLLSLLHSINH
jgi:hypothetical protein